MSRYRIDSYKGDLLKIVRQLESCGYRCEGGSLILNIAFIALKEMATGVKADGEEGVYDCSVKRTD